MKISPCGKVRENPVISQDTKPEVQRKPIMEWKKVICGTNTHYTAKNSHYEVDITEGCFGRSVHIHDFAQNNTTHQHLLFRDASLEELQVKMEDSYLHEKA